MSEAWEEKLSGRIDLNRLPKHIAIIMDGNGRWATARGLPRTSGHAAGAETFRRIATFCKNIGIENLTVYAFSTENWKRSETEVSAIMKLLHRYLEECIRDMERDNIRLTFFGDLTALSPDLQKLCEKTREISRRCTGIRVNICLNYGGRDEIVRAARSFAAKCAAGDVAPEELTEAEFSKLLYSADVPDAELVIRPGGELRISNFLLWQSAYAEYYFTDTLWPDFTEESLIEAIAAFQSRSRRFGGV